MLRPHQLVLHALLGLLLPQQLLADHHIPAEVGYLSGQFQIGAGLPEAPKLVFVELEVAALSVRGEIDVDGFFRLTQLGRPRQHLPGTIFPAVLADLIYQEIAGERALVPESLCRPRGWQIIAESFGISECFLSQSLCSLKSPRDVFFSAIDASLFL
jgi:hypothetical protein